MNRGNRKDFNGKVWIGLIVTVLIGALLRIYGLGDESIWIDEGQTVAHATKSLSEIVKYCARDVHPPLYLFLIHFWTAIFGTSEFSLRMPSALFGIGTLILTFFFTKRLINIRTALLATLFMAISYMGISFSQEARSYAMLLLAIILSYHALLSYLEEKKLRYAIYYILSLSFILYVHYFAVFIILSHQLYFIYRLIREPGNRNKRIISWIGINIGALIIYSPWIYFLINQVLQKLGGKGPGSWVAKPDIYVLYRTFVQLAGGKLPLLIVAISLVGFIITALIWRSNETDREEGKYRAIDIYMLIFFWFLATIPVPFVLSWIITPIYVERYGIQFLPGFCIFLAYLFTRFRPKVIARVLLTLFIITSIIGLYYYYTTLDKEQWRDVAAYIKKRAKPNQAIVLSAPWIYEPFVYYFGKTQKPRIIQAFEYVDIMAETHNYDEVWLVQAHEFFSDPEGKVPKEISKEHVLRHYKDFKEGARIDPILVHFQSIRVSFYDRGDALKYCKKKKSFIPGLDDDLLTLKENVKEVNLPDGTKALSFTKGTRLRYDLKDSSRIEKGSISFWFIPTWGEEKAQKRVILMAEGSSWNKNTIFLETDSSGMLRAVAFGDSAFSGTTEVGPIDWSKKEWHLIVITWNNNRLNLYVDGKLSSESNFVNPFIADFKTLHIGGDQRNKFPAPGIYDDLSFYSYTMTPEDVNKLKKASLLKEAMFWFDFDQKGRRSIKDKDLRKGFRTNSETFFLAPLSSIRTGNLHTGMMEVKIRPNWDGNDGRHYVLITLFGNDWNKGSIYLEKTSQNVLQAIRWEDGKVSCWVGTDIKDWKKGEWHSIYLSWFDKSMSLQVDKNKRIQYPYKIPPKEGFKIIFIGSDASYKLTADALFKDLRFKG